MTLLENIKESIEQYTEVEFASLSKQSDAKPTFYFSIENPIVIDTKIDNVKNYKTFQEYNVYLNVAGKEIADLDALVVKMKKLHEWHANKGHDFPTWTIAEQSDLIQTETGYAKKYIFTTSEESPIARTGDKIGSMQLAIGEN